MLNRPPIGSLSPAPPNSSIMMWATSGIPASLNPTNKTKSLTPVNLYPLVYSATGKLKSGITMAMNLPGVNPPSGVWDSYTLPTGKPPGSAHLKRNLSSANYFDSPERKKSTPLHYLDLNSILIKM